MILYKPGKVPFFTEGSSLTEQEHLKSTDVKIMLHRAAKGLPVLGSNRPPTYGHDDMNMDLTQHLINKKTVESELNKLAQTTELSEEEMKSIPPSIKKKFGFKTKKASQVAAPPKNDDKTTNNGVSPTNELEQKMPISSSITHRS